MDLIFTRQKAAMIWDAWPLSFYPQLGLDGRAPDFHLGPDEVGRLRRRVADEFVAKASEALPYVRLAERCNDIVVDLGDDRARHPGGGYRGLPEKTRNPRPPAFRNGGHFRVRGPSLQAGSARSPSPPRLHLR